MARRNGIPNLGTLATRELLSLWAGTLRELHDRGVVRTFNNPIGDIAEELVAVHFQGERGSFSQVSWDVRTPDDELLQVKALRRKVTQRLLDHPDVSSFELSDELLDA